MKPSKIDFCSSGIIKRRESFAFVCLCSSGIKKVCMRLHCGASLFFLFNSGDIRSGQSRNSTTLMSARFHSVLFALGQNGQCRHKLKLSIDISLSEKCFLLPHRTTRKQPFLTAEKRIANRRETFFSDRSLARSFGLK